MKKLFDSNEGDKVWIHAASLGEFEQGRPIIEELKRANPGTKVVLTFFSPSGYEIRKNYELADWVLYLPLDTPKNAKEFVNLINPKVAVFIKYEFWYYLLKELVDRNTPVLMVSAIFRKNQLFFHWSGSFFQSVFRKVTHFYVQDEVSEYLIKDINPNVTVAGDTRFDRVITISEHAASISLIEAFVDNRSCFVIGSSWESDLDIIEPFVKANQGKVRFIIAPHNVNEAEISKLSNRFENTTLFSNPSLENSEVLIIDNIGMLSSIYSHADYAFIGGGFRGALHNTLEAAVYGIPIFFGRHENNAKFREAILLEGEGGAFPVQKVEELIERFKLLSDPKEYKKASNASKNFVHSNSGATELVVKKLIELL